MKFSFHNKLEINVNGIKRVFFNTMLTSLLQKLSNFESYNQYLCIGNGVPDTEKQSKCTLTNYLTQATLNSKQIQSEIDKDILYATYQYKIKKTDINSTHISEVGLGENEKIDENNPTIYNYFSLISDDSPNGIDISNLDEIVFEITIYLNLSEDSDFLLTAGKNVFIEFLLGNGLDEVYTSTGSNFANNARIKRTITENQPLQVCEKSASIINNTLTLSFENTLSQGEIDEILYVSNKQVFARKNLKEHNDVKTGEITTTPKANYVIKLEEDIKTISSIKRNSDNASETNYFATNYANSYGDKVFLPFGNLFDANTPRFISKYGQMILFVYNSKVYAYQNKNFMITEINTREITDENIKNIISFDKFIFIISETDPYISTYIVSENTIKKVENNFGKFEHYAEFETMQAIDITLSNDNTFMLGILTNTNTALTLYFTFDNSLGFEIGDYITNSKQFNYVLAMYKNNFCDARMIYLKEGESSLYCRIVTHMPDKSETDVYSSLAYSLTNNCTKIYAKSRGIISEKNADTKIVIFYYPQMFQYNLPLISDEVSDYISHNLNYIIQKLADGSYKTYNLVGYDTPESFTNDISDLVNHDKILDIEFLDDTVLFFLDDDLEKVVAFNLKLNKTQIENVSKNDDSYSISYLAYDKLGKSGQAVNFSFVTQVNLWYFQTKFLK